MDSLALLRATTCTARTDPPPKGRQHREVLTRAPLVLFSRTDCARCTRLKRLLRGALRVRATQLYIEELDHWDENELARLRRALPLTAHLPALYLLGKPLPPAEHTFARLAPPLASLPSSAPIRAVLFDVGGVLVDSPLLEMARYEHQLRLPEHFFAGVISATGGAGAFAQLERGQLTVRQFCTRFEQECATHATTHLAHRGAARLVSGRRFLACVLRVAAHPPRPRYLSLVRALKRMGLLIGVITNNWNLSQAPSTDAPSAAATETDVLSRRAVQAMRRLRNHFDLVVESHRVHARKPERRIYELATSQLQVRPEECVFIDDLGINLKAARAYGMHTVQVRPNTQFASLLAQLEYLLRREIPLERSTVSRL
jgi:putative hydrolase of the HAD superfamily